MASSTSLGDTSVMGGGSEDISEDSASENKISVVEEIVKGQHKIHHVFVADYHE